MKKQSRDKLSSIAQKECVRLQSIIKKEIESNLENHDYIPILQGLIMAKLSAWAMANHLYITKQIVELQGDKFNTDTIYDLIKDIYTTAIELYEEHKD